MEVKSFQDEFVTLKTAIEGAINEGQESIDDLNNIPTSGLVLKKGLAITHVSAGLGVVGWVDDF